jgi:hypothetical protein
MWETDAEDAEKERIVAALQDRLPGVDPYTFEDMVESTYFDEPNAPLEMAMKPWCAIVEKEMDSYIYGGDTKEELSAVLAQEIAPDVWGFSGAEITHIFHDGKNVEWVVEMRVIIED